MSPMRERDRYSLCRGRVPRARERPSRTRSMSTRWCRSFSTSGRGRRPTPSRRTSPRPRSTSGSGRATSTTGSSGRSPTAAARWSSSAPASTRAPSASGPTASPISRSTTRARSISKAAAGRARHGGAESPSSPAIMSPPARCALLEANGFDRDLPSFFIWEGNTMYLTEADAKKVLRDLKEGVRAFSIAFDYMDSAVVGEDDRRGGNHDLRRTLRRHGRALALRHRRCRCARRGDRLHRRRRHDGRRPAPDILARAALGIDRLRALQPLHADIVTARRHLPPRPATD